MQAFDFVAPLLQKLPEQESQKCASIITNIGNPEKCWLDFFVPEASEAGVFQEDDEDQEEVLCAIGESKLNSLKGEFNKATGSLLELLVELMRGRYLADCRKLAKDNVKLAKAVSEVAVQAVPADGEEDSSSCSSLGFVKAMFLVVQAFDTSTKFGSVSEPQHIFGTRCCRQRAGLEANPSRASQVCYFLCGTKVCQGCAQQRIPEQWQGLGTQRRSQHIPSPCDWLCRFGSGNISGALAHTIGSSSRDLEGSGRVLHRPYWHH